TASSATRRKARRLCAKIAIASSTAPPPPAERTRLDSTGRTTAGGMALLEPAANPASAPIGNPAAARSTGMRRIHTSRRKGGRQRQAWRVHEAIDDQAAVTERQRDAQHRHHLARIDRRLAKRSRKQHLEGRAFALADNRLQGEHQREAGRDEDNEKGADHREP